jgi:hypothetical protein
MPEEHFGARETLACVANLPASLKEVPYCQAKGVPGIWG